MKTNISSISSSVFALTLAASLLGSMPAQALYTVPSNPFIAPGEVPVTLNISSGTIAQVQAQIVAARAANPSKFIVINLSGTYTVSTTPLTLTSKEILKLNGTIKAASSTATATALIAVNSGQSFVAIMGTGTGGILDGVSANLNGVKVAASSRIVVDKLTVRNTDQDGISLQGLGNTVWDAQNSVTRCDVSGGNSGIKISSANQAVLVDNNCHNNRSAGINLGADNTSVANNKCTANTSYGIFLGGAGNTLCGNTVDGNPTGVHISSASSSATVLNNIVRNSSTVGIVVAGSGNTAFDNTFSGNGTNVTSSGSGNNIIATMTALSGTGNNYFYPPTARNPHTSTAIANGKGRFNLSISSTTIASVQQQYNAAVTAHPNDVIVLSLTGTFTLGSAPLTLSSYTCVLLGSTTKIVSNSSTTALQAITAANKSYISVSGGLLDAAGSPVSGIYFSYCSTTLIDGVSVKNAGQKAVRGGSDLIRLMSGGGVKIVRGCTLDTSNARGIWTQAAGGFIISGNTVANCNMDGVDFDSGAVSSLAYNNTLRDCIRNGVFIEEGSKWNKVIGNSLLRNYSGVGSYAMYGTPTSYNSIICNTCDSNTRGVSSNNGSGKETGHNYYFNNVVKNSTQFGYCVYGDSPANYYSETVSLNNPSDTANSQTVFFNP